MTVSRAQFLVEYPGFSDAPVTLVDAKLIRAAGYVSATAAGTDYDHLVYLKTAELLAEDSLGQAMAFEKNRKPSQYGAEFKLLLRQKGQCQR